MRVIIPSDVASFSSEEGPVQSSHVLGRRQPSQVHSQSNLIFSTITSREELPAKPFPQVRKISCQLNAAISPRLKDYSDHIPGHDVKPLSWVSGSQEDTRTPFKDSLLPVWTLSSVVTVLSFPVIRRLKPLFTTVSLGHREAAGGLLSTVEIKTSV